jgi:two-component system, OmpR family, phosphate regulon sensor histidine kinase PhoR
LANSYRLRVVIAVVAGLFPVVALLAVLAALGTVSIWLVVAVSSTGLAVGVVAAAAVVGDSQRRAERIDAVAEALEARQAPPHLMRQSRDAVARAEHRLLDAADSIVSEVQSLTDQRDEFEAILRSMTEAVVVTGSRGEVVLLNGAARRMFALDHETDYAGRDFVELCRDPLLQDFVAHAMRNASEVLSSEFMIQNPTQHYVAASAAPVSMTHHGVWVFVFHDVTQLRAYETVRTDFISNLTHELRTPLAALYGYAETLMQGVDDSELQRRFLGIIDRQARRLARLLDDLISLSDLERGHSTLHFEDLEAPSVIGEAAELMKVAAAHGGVHLEVQPSEGLPKLFGDHDRLHQVMVNLLDNAIKYTPRGGHVTASAKSGTLNGTAKATPAVALMIADTGEGIPERDIPRLTERFYRVDRARSRELGGTGLGLAIVKHIVQLHQGSLKIESRVGVGTTVIVMIPAAESQKNDP